jgi:dCTP deaminase
VILTDREILIALRCGQLKIDPQPGPEALSSTSIDLTLGTTFTEWQFAEGVSIRPGKKGYKYTALLPFQKTQTLQQYTLPSKAFVLAWTVETVTLPINSRIAARVEGKSGMARLGVGIHVTAPTVHSGFSDPLQLEIFNFGPNEIILDAGMRICQLIIEYTAGTPERGYEGIFAGQDPKKGR